MSKKPAKHRKLAAVKASAMREDLEAQLKAAKEAQVEKLALSKEHLVGQLEVASEKYLTVNGFMQGCVTMREAALGFDLDEDTVKGLGAALAREMSKLAASMAKELEAMDVVDLTGDFVEKHLDRDFIAHSHKTPDVAKQLLIVNLLQNVGPSVEEIIGFRDRTNAELVKLEDELAKELDKEKKKKA